MTYPNQPGTPGYPPYPPQQPQYYSPTPPPTGYYQQQGPPPQQWQQPAPQAPVLARGTLEDYLDQPTGGGGAATSKFFTPQRPVGSWLQLVVARDLNNNDVRQQTDKYGTPLTFKSNGKPKFVLIIPCNVLSSSDGSHVNIYPEGQVTVWLKGVPSDSFKSAMRISGVSDPDRALALGQLAGASFYMIGAGTKQFGAGNPANMFDFQYTPNGRELYEAPSQAQYEAAAMGVTAPPAPVPPTPAPAPVATQMTASVPGPPAADPNLAYYQATGQLPPTVTAGAIPAPVNAPQQPPPPPYAQTGAPPVPPPGAGIPSAAPPATAQYATPPPPPGVPSPPPGMPPVPPPGLPQQPPPPPGYAPAQYASGQPQLDPEKAALLQRLQGQQ